MKKLIIFLFLLLVQGVTCAAQEDKMAVIKGTWDRTGTKEVVLYQVVSGRLETLSTYVLQEDDKTFGFAFPVREEGFYVIGAGSQLAQSDKYTFYFKPEDVLSVSVNDTSYTLTGDNTQENIALADWERYIHPLKFMSVYFYKTLSTYKDFFPLLSSYLQKPYTTTTTHNRVFDDLFIRYQTVNFIDVANFFFSTPRSIHPAKEEYPDFYANINVTALTSDTFLLHYFAGTDLLLRLFRLKAMLNNNDIRTIPLGDILAEIESDALKGEYLLAQALLIKSYMGYVALMDQFGQYVILPDQKRRATEIVTKLAKEETKPGQPAINFTGTDINGKTVSLSDFKGKVVYVDVWATWCGPCIQESPHFERLLEEYSGKDVVFIGISVDVAKDKPKWETFLKEKGARGVQLFGGNGWDSEVAKYYQVNSIPRFLLFDKNGNIVSIDAPRPSSAEIKVVLDAQLKIGT